MNKLLKYGWSVLLGLAMFTSCSSEEDAVTGASGPEPVKFAMYTSMPGETRVTVDYLMRTVFTQKDSVGIFVYRRTADGADGELYAANVKYTYDGAYWTASSADAIMTEPGTALNFYAYYPYRSDMTEYGQMSCSVQIAQNEVLTKDENGSENEEENLEGIMEGYGRNYAAGDVMTAKNTSCEAGECIVPLTFGHTFALVRVCVTGTEATDTLATVKLLGMKTGATIDVRSGAQLSAEGTPSDIAMLQVSNAKNNMFYLAMVPAQDIAAGTDLIEVTTAVRKNEKDEGVKTIKRYPCKEALSLIASCSHTLVVLMGEEISFEPGPDTGGMNVTQWLEDEDVEMDKVE